MSNMSKTNRRIVLASHPTGAPTESNFQLETVERPEPGPNEVLVEALYLSLDPYMRGRMNKGPSYSAPVPIGGVMEGGIVGRVIESRHPKLAVGDLVESKLGWQEYAVAHGDLVRKLDPSFQPVSLSNGLLGLPGLTAYFGLFEVGRPKVGETVVVSAAAGAVGQVAGQLARLAGCRVVGIAGGADKCSFLQGELGFDACVDYKGAPDIAAALRTACPDGIDVYFDNVGGPVSDAVFAQLNFFARVAVCGNVSEYNATTPVLGPRPFRAFVGKRVVVQGFLNRDYKERHPRALKDLARLYQAGKLKHREQFIDGLENAPRALISLLEGKNFGKLQVRIHPDAN